MYDLKMLEEIKSQEERIHFSSFDYNDAYTLGTMLRERGLTTPKPIAIRIVFDDIILYQSFLPGTDESNNQWMNRKQHTVERCHTSSLRAAVGIKRCKRKLAAGRVPLCILRRWISNYCK